jgi:hypothetical protein
MVPMDMMQIKEVTEASRFGGYRDLVPLSSAYHDIPTHQNFETLRLS